MMIEYDYVMWIKASVYLVHHIKLTEVVFHSSDVKFVEDLVTLNFSRKQLFWQQIFPECSGKVTNSKSTSGFRQKPGRMSMQHLG